MAFVFPESRFGSLARFELLKFTPSKFATYPPMRRTVIHFRGEYPLNGIHPIVASGEKRASRARHPTFGLFLRLHIPIDCTSILTRNTPHLDRASKPHLKNKSPLPFIPCELPLSIVEGPIHFLNKSKKTSSDL